VPLAATLLLVLCGSALLVKLGYDAKAEKRPTGLVYNFHAPFRTSFNWIVQITEYFAGGFYRFQLNRAHVWERNSVAMVVRRLVTVTDHKKIFRQPFAAAVSERFDTENAAGVP